MCWWMVLFHQHPNSLNSMMWGPASPSKPPSTQGPPPHHQIQSVATVTNPWEGLLGRLVFSGFWMTAGWLEKSCFFSGFRFFRFPWLGKNVVKGVPLKNRLFKSTTLYPIGMHPTHSHWRAKILLACDVIRVVTRENQWGASTCNIRT